jgi:DnaK suppressor protein
MSSNNGRQWRGDREGLRRLLSTRRRQLSEELQIRMARIRENGSDPTLAQEPDDGDASDLDMKLIEIHAATLRRIDLALERLDEGRYGRCTRCEGAIAAARLRAMPFAVCCQQCETAREQETALQEENHRPSLRGRLFSPRDIADPGVGSREPVEAVIGRQAVMKFIDPSAIE